MHQGLIVSSTGGKSATCYVLVYALGLLPLVLAALFIFGSSTFMFSTSAFTGTMRLEESYGLGGMTRNHTRQWSFKLPNRMGSRVRVL
jgi:hypothetical protein